MPREIGRTWLIAAAIIAALGVLEAQPAKKLALVGGMLLDGYEVPPLHHAAVLVEGDRIVQVGRAADIRIPPDATVIDTSGRTMLPGLMDLHAHLVIVGHGAYNRWFPWLERHAAAFPLERIMEISARQLLTAGVTTAVDLGATLKESLSVRDRIKRGEIPGPRLLVSGPWIARNVGLFPPQFDRKVTSPEEAARAAEELIEAGVDVIKAHAGLTAEDYRAIVGVARPHNTRVHAHVYAETDVRNALEAGVDVLTHAGSAGTTPPYSPEMIRDIVNAGRPVVITAAHRAWIYPDTIAFPERLQDPRLKADFPPELYKEVQDSLKDWHTLGYFQRTDREVFFRERGLKQFIEAGAVMGMGTDSGTPANFHTEALWREMKAHVDMGMSPARVISAATRINARLIGRGRDLGTIEPGKIADIIVVKGDPLFSIIALADVEVVVRDGIIFKGGPRDRARPSSGGKD